MKALPSSSTHALPQDPLGDLAQKRLRRRGYAELAQLNCRGRRDRTLVVTGSLPSYYLKQVALAVVTAVPGVNQILDEIEVRRGRRKGKSASPP